MALSVYSGDFVITTGTGLLTETGVGFQPKAVLFSYVRGAAEGTAVSIQLCIGAATSAANEGAVTITSSNASAEHDSARKCNSTRSLLAVTTGTSTSVMEAELTEMQADGFQINKTQQTDSARTCRYVCIGGDDLTNAKLHAFTSPASTGNASVTGVGFPPDCIILFGCSTATSGTGEDDEKISMGWATSSTSRAAYTLRTR
jgi:hypothetical protein